MEPIGENPVAQMDLGYHGPWSRNQDHGPGTRDQDQGPWARDHGPWARDQDHGPWARDQVSAMGNWNGRLPLP